MDRVIVYDGQVPFETDVLNTNKFAMLGLGYLAQDLLGGNTAVSGLACTPTGPASLNVLVAPGRIYSLQNVDNTAYSSVALDTTHQVVKQGILLASLQLACPPPGTAGQSINYLIEATYQDSDTGSSALPYYNSANPTVPFSGPGNSGTAQPIVRQGLCVVQAKAGVAATTGTQTTPAADTGFVGLFVVTVANGQTTITSGNISQVAGAPFAGTNGANHGAQSFTANGTFIVPPGVTQIYVSGCGGGGGGGGGAGNNNVANTAGGGGGGGAGQAAIKTPFAVTAASSIAITIGAAGSSGAGGAAGQNNGTGGGAGGSTIVGSLATLTGGSGGNGGNNTGTTAGAAGGQGGAGTPNGGFGADGLAGGAGGMGASSTFGGGGSNVRGTNTGAGIAGNSGGGFGSGGGGGSACYGANSAAGGAGAAGKAGYVVIEW